MNIDRYFKSLLPLFRLFCCLLSCLIAYWLQNEPLLADSTQGKSSYFTVKNSGLEVPILDGFILEKNENPEVIGIFRLPGSILPEINIVRIPKINRTLSPSAWAQVVKDDYARVGITTLSIISSENIEAYGAQLPIAEISYARGGNTIRSLVAYASTTNEGFVITLKEREESFPNIKENFQSLLKGIKLPIENSSQNFPWSIMILTALIIAALWCGYKLFMRSV